MPLALLSKLNSVLPIASYWGRGQLMAVGGVPLYPSLPYEVVQKSAAVHTLLRRNEDTILGLTR